MNIISCNLKYSQKWVTFLREHMVDKKKIYIYTASPTMHWNMDSKYSKKSFHMSFLFNVNICLNN